MNQQKPKITLRMALRDQLRSTYQVEKITDAVVVEYTDDSDPNKPVQAVLRVGDRVTERVAQSLVGPNEVTTLVAKS